MPDNDEPKPGTLESWEKYLGQTENTVEMLNSVTCTILLIY